MELHSNPSRQLVRCLVSRLGLTMAQEAYHAYLELVVYISQQLQRVIGLSVNSACVFAG